MRVAHICLITPGHVSSCPRLMKEADALHEAGYQVTVVAGRNFPPVDALDEAVIARARWQCSRVPTDKGTAIAWRRLSARALGLLRGDAPCGGLKEALLVISPAVPDLVRAAVGTDADIYHAHAVPGLAAAALAARKTGRKYGFDAEDFHEQETTEVERSPRARSIVRQIMGAYLPIASVRTAASPLIAAAFKERYGCGMTTILNSFGSAPESACTRSDQAFSKEHPAKLYWFSQTIGPGRGLEQIVDTLGLVKTPVRLQLRGFAGERYREELTARAKKANVALDFLAPADPDGMVKLAAGADIGLSLEQREPGNRNLCLTNKVFVYIAAGIPQLLSRTAAQEALAREIGAAGLLVDLEDAPAAAQKLDALLSNTEQMQFARAATTSAQERFGWPVERAKLVEAFRRALN